MARRDRISKTYRLHVKTVRRRLRGLIQLVSGTQGLLFGLAEEVAEHVAQDRGERQGDDRTKDAAKTEADSNQEQDRGRSERDHLAFERGHQDRALNLERQEIEDQN